jgi:probable rRNA maturation factor
VALLADEPILELNRTWLGHDWVPDVLSFALHDAGEPPVADIYVGVEQAARQARDHGVSLEEELVRLCIHGTLHVLGYDHSEAEARSGGDPETSHLFAAQEALVRKVMAEPSPGAPAPDRRGGSGR